MDALRGRFGKYHVLDKIAQGGMAEIYKVKTVGLAGFEKIQALKRILPSAAQQGRFIRSFIDEARIAVELSHRNIVQVFDFGKAEGDLYLAMELIEGQDLRSAMTSAAAKNLRCPLPVAAYIVSEVAAGLDYAHRKADAAGRSLGIVHCDMSPSNVMLSTDGYVKILDFGIARASFSSALERRRLRGKPRYMAPEQTRGDAPTAATDVFALGIIAWELLSGRPLFGGNTLRDILHEVRTFEVPHLRDEVPSVPAEMADAIAVALQRDPALRGTAADLGTACVRTALASGPRGVAGWQEELDQRGSSPLIAHAAGSGIERVPGKMRREVIPRRPSAISFELRPVDLSGGDGIELPADVELASLPGSGGEPIHSDTEAQFPWDDAVPVERRTATVPAATPMHVSLVSSADSPLAGFVPETVSPPTVDLVSPSIGAATPEAGRRVARIEDLDDVAMAAMAAQLPEAAAPPAASARPSTTMSTTRPSTTMSTARPSTTMSTTRPSASMAAAALPPLAAPATPSAMMAAVVEPVSTAEGTPPFSSLPIVAAPVAAPVPAPVPAPVADPAEPELPSAAARLPTGPVLPSGPTGADGNGRLWGFDVRSYDSESVHDEAIDDHPDAFDMDAVAALVNRRRIVVVVALLDGAPAESLRALARVLADLAYQRGGVALANDDRVLTLAFGLELAGEDDVAVAMTWAVDASAIARDTIPDGSAPQLRVGGRAGAIATITADAPPQLDPEAVAQARELARQARPDRPLFTGGAGRLSSALFTLREVSPAPGQDSGPRDRTLELVGVRPVDERDSALLERRGRFVGRQRELAILESARQRAVAEQRRVVAVIGGASGAGKSRLAAELVARIREQSPRTILMVASAGPATRLSPFCLVLDFLQAVLHLPPQRGRAARDKLGQRLLRVLRRAELEPEVVKAVMGDLELAMELRDGVGDTGAFDLADLRNRVGAALTVVRRCLRALLEPEPPGAAPYLTAVVVIENLQHADAPSLEAMRLSIGNREPGAELFVMTTEAEPPAWPFLDEELELRDLMGGELRTLAVDRLGEAATALNVASVISRGGGTPLFVEELAAAVRQGGGDELPGNAHDVVAARIERLSPPAKMVARYAAVIGERVRARLLEELLGQDELGEGIEELVRAGLFERRDGAVPQASEGELVFARGLFREVVYDGLSTRARRDAHGRVGRLLVARFFAGREEPPAVIAEHLEKGGEVAAAAAFWLRAGRIALAAADAEEAVRHFSRCLELEASLGEPPPSAPSRVRRREALLGREEAQRLLGDLQTGDTDLAALEELCQEQPRRLADLANRRAQRQLRRGDHAGALTATLRAEQLARAAGDERLRAEALRLRGEVYEVQGQLDQALSFVAQAGTIFRRYGYLTDEIAAMVGTGRIHLLRAHYEAARDSYRPVIASLQKSGDPWLERVVRNHLALIEMCLGNFSEAMQLAQRSIELCRRYGDRAREGDTLSVTALIFAKVGLYDQAAATFASALDILGSTASRWSRAECLIAAGACDVRRGQRDGLKKLDEAIAEARQLGARTLEANGLVARAEARLRLGEASAAIPDAEAGAEVARKATLVGCEIQGLTQHAVALHQLGHTAQAVPLASRALTLLDAQGYLEGAEEEVLQACGQILCAGGERERGERALGRGRAAATRKLAALTDPSWRAAYAAVLEKRPLLRES